MADLQAMVDTMVQWSEESVVTVITSVLQARPELAQPVMTFAVPDLTYPPQKAIAERRQAGVIKSFYEDKGYGFVACDETAKAYGTDVFLHHSQLKDFSIGDQVSFAIAVSTDNKPQAFDLQDLSSRPKGGMMCKGAGKDIGKGWVKGGVPPRQDSAQVIGVFSGTIKTFNKLSGYGFIDCPELKGQFAQDVFVHHSQLGGFNQGDFVKFTVCVNQHGKPQAQNLEDASQQKRPRLEENLNSFGGDAAAVGGWC